MEGENCQLSMNERRKEDKTKRVAHLYLMMYNYGPLSRDFGLEIKKGGNDR